MVVCYVNVFMMGKLSNEDKNHIQTLHEQGLGAKAIRASYPDKNWSLSTLQPICRRVDETGSAVTRRTAAVGQGLHVTLKRMRKMFNITTTCSDVENDVIFQRILNT